MSVRAEDYAGAGLFPRPVALVALRARPPTSASATQELSPAVSLSLSMQGVGDEELGY